MALSAGDHSLLLVHAHPDDESIGTGATMAKYAAEGARVTLVTCTLGEMGEIIPPDLRHLLLRRNVNTHNLRKSGSSPFHNAGTAWRWTNPLHTKCSLRIYPHWY